MAAPSSRAFRNGRRAGLLGLALLTGACEQPNDVVATVTVSALGDAALPPEPDAGPSSQSCETTQLYVLLSSIVRDDCRVPSSLSAHTALAMFFNENPPGNLPGEERPVSACDLFAGRFWFYQQVEGSDQGVLCPAHCALATQYVEAEAQRVLDCQGFGG